MAKLKRVEEERKPKTFNFQDLVGIDLIRIRTLCQAICCFAGESGGIEETDPGQFQDLANMIYALSDKVERQLDFTLDGDMTVVEAFEHCENSPGLKEC